MRAADRGEPLPLASGTRPRVLVLSGAALFRSFFDRPRLARLRRRFIVERRPDRALTPALRRRLSRADALITTWDSPRLEDEVLGIAPALRAIVHCGGEVKARFGPALFPRLIIANAPGPMAAPVAELALAFVLADVRRLEWYRHAFVRGEDACYRHVHLHGTSGQTAAGTTVGIIGLGRIGRTLAGWLLQLGAHVEAYDPRRTGAPEGVRMVRSLDMLIRRCRVLVLAAALTPATRRLLDRRRLALLPDGALVVNIGRGALVDLDALTREVARGRLRCALDVTDPEEPLPRTHPLRRLPGALVTPHVGASDVSVRHAMADSVIETLERVFAGLPVETRVTPAMLRTMT